MVRSVSAEEVQYKHLVLSIPQLRLEPPPYSTRKHIVKRGQRSRRDYTNQILRREAILLGTLGLVSSKQSTQALFKESSWRDTPAIN